MKKIQTANAPAAIGPYSQGIQVGQFLFISGQLPINPDTGLFPEGDIRDMTVQVLKNIQEILKEAGGTMNNVVKTTIFVKDLRDFAFINEVYDKFFDSVPPTRSCVEVSNIPKGAPVEIEAIATLCVEK